jgi:phosphoribosyl 1,2-cyclic phosphate phosphodiesterase
VKVRLLGTGASEGFPAIFCDCPVCSAARRLGGKDLRSRSGALVDDILKIDLGPDTLCQIHRDRLNPVTWKHVVYTHSDDDHFAVRELQYLFPPFTTGNKAEFDVGANETILRQIHKELKGIDGLRTYRLPAFEAVDVGPYRITGVRAAHLDEEEALNLLVDDGRAQMLYATDTGWWPDETWEFLESLARPLDLLVIDCTHGGCDCTYRGHLNIDQVLELRRILLKDGALLGRSRVITTHHCHRGGLTHDQLAARLVPHGIEVGYDGLEVSL